METVLGLAGVVLFFFLLDALLQHPKVLMGLIALGAVYLFLPDQASYVTTGVVGVGTAYFVSLPVLFTWAWPVIALVGVFVLVNALLPSKGT